LVVRGSPNTLAQFHSVLDSIPSIQLIHSIPDNARHAPGLLLSLQQLPPSSHDLKLIEEFHSAGGRVVCTAAGLSKLTLGERCKLLLSGAGEFFDEDADGYLTHLRSTIEALAVQENARFDELQRLQAHMKEAGIVGVSPPLTEVFRQVERVAPFSDLPLLIAGETGTGKELVAQAVHALDPRRRGAPFVSVNCGSLPDSLSESEMFGFRRGSFTGADRDRPGLFRSAHNGILFLDEIGELSASAQAKLLRVLQNGRVLPIGEDRETQVDVRVLAATNRDLEEMVQKGQFREDLYHRINVLRISLPALRERPEDIEPLAKHFAHKYRHVSRGSAVSFAPDFVAALQALELPGNVRQLENLIRKALLAANERRTLSLRDLPKDLWNELAQGKGSFSQAPEDLRTSQHDFVRHCLERHGWNLASSVQWFERELLKFALDASDGNQSEAARRLGITARSVYNKLHRSKE
jgi:transcriptional regulator with GAF, ATPase, and Fis domain